MRLLRAVLLLGGLCLGLVLPVAAPAAPQFSVAPEQLALESNGSPDLRAGSHPWELATKLSFSANGEDLRDLEVALPSGLVEDPSALDQCSQVQFNDPRHSPYEVPASGESCPDRSQIGVATLTSSHGGGETRSFGIFNLQAPPGIASEFGFNPYGAPITFVPRIRQTNGEFGLSLESRNFTQRFAVHSLELRIWGVPWNLTHNAKRGNCLNEVDPEDPWGKCSVGRPELNPAQAYLSLPPSCAAPLETGFAADSWQHHGTRLPDGQPDPSDPEWSTATALSRDEAGAPAALGLCNQLTFNPETTARLTTGRAASPTGFDLSFEYRDSGLTNPLLTAPSQPKRAVVSLPEGMTINSSFAAGLGVCTAAQYAAETASSPPGAGCPNASKIGTVNVATPLYPEPVSGGLFLAQPDDPRTAAPGTENPFDSLLAVYLIAKDPNRGILVKLAGELHADPGSSQLTASFDGLPQLPYSHFLVHFREGNRSPLLTPPSCGSYLAQTTLSPWLDPSLSLPHSSTLTIGEGPEGRSCPGGTAPAFVPAVQAGSLNSNAGSYSPFYLHIERADTEAEITSYSTQLPPGLLGRIAGIPFCGGAQIEAAKRQSGIEAAQNPTCPAASQIGHTNSGYGVGPVLAYAPGAIYLAGPYNGSPLSIVAVDPAVVGPFDLGTIVIRSAIHVDPRSAQVSIDSAASDPIPHILDGIPLHLRDVRVYLDRPEFMRDPTSCEPFSALSTMTGSSAPFIDPRADTYSGASPYQMSNCSSLGFEPKLSLALRGSTRHGGDPALRAILTPRPDDANIAQATVTLPSTELLDQRHIAGLCSARQLESQSCPPDSSYGTATAYTPLLSEPLSGPIYLRTGEDTTGVPDLVADLHEGAIRILLEGKISQKGGLTGRFVGLPDAPLTKFVFALDGGRRGLLTNEQPLCAAPRFAKARLVGQQNTGEALRPKVRLSCPHKQRRKSR